jgi:acyl carrier protein
MEELIVKLAEILEVEDLDVTKKFTDYEEFDSLAALMILATLDSDYNKTMKASDIRGFESIEAFCKEVLA